MICHPMEMVPTGMLDERDAQQLIMEARKHWFEDEEDTVNPAAVQATTAKESGSNGKNA